MIKGSRISGMRFPDRVQYRGIQYHVAHTAGNRAYACGCIGCIKLKDGRMKHGLITPHFRRRMFRTK